MKRLFAAAAAVCILFCGCSVTLMGNRDQQIPYETFDTKPVPEDPTKMIQYKTAMEALANLNYRRALDLFTELGDFKDAAAYAARFTYIEDTLLRTEQYTDGVLTKTNELTYGQDGELIGSAQSSGVLMESVKADNGNLKLETWQFADYFLTTTYDAYTNIGVVTKEEKRPLFHNMNVDGVKKGYTIHYVYDNSGKLLKDQGEIQQHTLKNGKVSISKMLFNGVYYYDANGKLQRYDRHYNWGGMGTAQTFYEYDDQNRVIREKSSTEGTVFFLKGLKEDEKYGYEDTVKEYRYDEDGNRIFFSQLTTTSLPGEPPTTTYIQTESEYQNGRLMLETTTFGSSSDTIIETCYVYGDYLAYLIEEEATGNGS